MGQGFLSGPFVFSPDSFISSAVDNQTPDRGVKGEYRWNNSLLTWE
jgi:hypothetical protein